MTSAFTEKTAYLRGRIGNKNDYNQLIKDLSCETYFEAIDCIIDLFSQEVIEYDCQGKCCYTLVVGFLKWKDGGKEHFTTKISKHPLFNQSNSILRQNINLFLLDFKS